MRCRFLIAVLGLTLVGRASAQLLDCNQPTCQRVDSNCCLRLGGVDDYCRKPCPLICPGPGCGGPDDYDRKCVPCIPNLTYCAGVDDYCRKALPTLLCPPWSPSLQWGSCQANAPTPIR